MYKNWNNIKSTAFYWLLFMKKISQPLYVTSASGQHGWDRDQMFPNTVNNKEKNTWTRSFKHWPSGSSGQYLQRKKHTHTHTHTHTCSLWCRPRMNECTHTHTHTHVPYGADPEWTNARTHTHTHTHVFPMAQTQNERMHTHTHTHRHLCFLWCRDRTQVARAHECWKAESCPGREPGGLAHAPEAPPYTTRESTHREWGAAPGSLKAERSLCFHLSEKKNLLIPRALRRVLPLQRRQKVKPSAVLTTLK